MFGRWPGFVRGEQGARFAEILGIAPERMTANASVVIAEGSGAIARIDLRLTAEELLQLTWLFTEAEAWDDATPD